MRAATLVAAVAVAAAAFPAAASANVIVTNVGGTAGSTTPANSVALYTSEGDVAARTPARLIAGAATGLDMPVAAARDAAGNIYVANAHGNSITEYAPTANGNAAPVRTIAGAATGLNGPWGLAVDPAGRIYVANSRGNTITEYAAGVTGNAAPAATIAGAATQLNGPRGLSRAGSGQLYVADTGANSVTVYAAGAKGNAAPVRTLANAPTGLDQPQAVWVLSNGDFWVSNDGNRSLTRYAAGASGNPAPLRTIAGPNTGLRAPAALASEGGLIVADTARGAVGIWGIPADGDAPPVLPSVVGPTGLNGPTGLLDLADVFVANAATLPNGRVGSAYSQSLEAADGFAPYHWSISAGTLPSGLRLDAATGTITGTPTAAGTARFTATVTDSSAPAGSASMSEAITVLPFVQPGVYVANGANNTITEYGQGAFGNVSPLTVLGGADGLDGPNGIAIDASGTVYVAEADNASITVHGVAGGPPARIAGPTTGLATPAGLALDDAGRLYVADPAANAVDVFAAGATGDARPVATIAGPHTGLSTPTAVTVIGTNVWVANANGNSLTEYRTFNNGDVTPAATIAGPGTALQHPVALAQDGAGHLLAANEFGESVTEYVPGNPQPIATIFGPATQLSFPDGIDVDTAGRIYVANQFGGVNAFAPGADGDVAPVGIVSGGATRLSAPGALAATPPLSILTRRLPHGRAGRRYRFRLRAGEGTTPYRWSLARGRLPRGLRLRRSGVIAGRPRHAGRRRIVVRVCDASHPRAHATRRLVLRVRARS